MSDETTVETPATATATPAEIPTAAAVETPPAAAQPETSKGKAGRSARMADLFERLTKPSDAAEKKEETPAAAAKDPAAEKKEVPEKKDPAAPAAPETPQEKADAKAFAALAREKQENLRLRNEAQEFHARAMTEAKAAAERASAAEKAAAEAKAKAEKLFSDPDAVFDHLASLGIRDLETLKRFAAKAWSKPVESVKPEERPLTRAEFEKLQAETRQKEEFSRVQRETYAAFEKHFDIPDDDAADIKFPHAAVGWSREKRIAEGDRIANQLAVLGRRVTLEEIAEAVEELAKQDPEAVKRVKRLGKKTVAETQAAGEKKSATQSVKPTVTQTVKTESAPEKKSNGVAKMSHKERLAALQAGLK